MANTALKMAIVQSELTSKELAQRVGIHPANMSAIANGAIPHLKTAQRIVRELRRVGVEVTIDDLWPLVDEE